MNFVFVVMEAELVDVAVCDFECGCFFGSEIGREAVLPELVMPLDFAFGLWGWSVAECDAVEMESLAQNSEGLRRGGEKEAVKIHVENQGQTVLCESLWEQIQVSWEHLPLVNF